MSSVPLFFFLNVLIGCYFCTKFITGVTNLSITKLTGCIVNTLETCTKCIKMHFADQKIKIKWSYACDFLPWLSIDSWLRCLHVVFVGGQKRCCFLVNLILFYSMHYSPVVKKQILNWFIFPLKHFHIFYSVLDSVWLCSFPHV